MLTLLNTLARRRGLSCALIFFLPLALRVALLPVWPIPLPAIYDEFSYLLSADTFAHGRLANPPHALPQFFETIEILQNPTYASRYPPAQGLILAAGQALFGNPWFGAWLSCGLLLAAVLWAAYGWLPRRWALATPLLLLHLCFADYWMNSFWGGAVAALGGTLLLGALGRLRANCAQPDLQRLILAAGVVILALSRPFEGLLLAVPVAFAAIRRTPGPRAWLAPALVVLAGLAWLGYYNYRVTGSPLKMPYQAYFEQYETVPPLLFLTLAEPNSRTYGHFNFELLDNTWMREQWDAAHTPGFVLRRAREWVGCVRTLIGNPLWIIPLAGLLPWFFSRRKTRFLAALLCLIVLATFSEPGLFAHYVAPFAAVFALLLVQSIRRLGAPGMACFVLLSSYSWGVFALQVARGATPDRFRAANAFRGKLEAALGASRDHVIFVHYTVAKIPHGEWIYNTADIDHQHVIWAQDMGPEQNKALLAYYPKRRFWYFEPDEPGAKPRPYTRP